MKTCSMVESEPLEAKQLAALLEFIPVLEDPAFCPGGVVPMDEDEMMEEEFSRLVSRLMDACYKNGFVVKFKWEEWETEAIGYLKDPGLLKDADLAIIRRLLTWHIRQNRFLKGHFANMIARGLVLAILKRLREIG